MKNPYKEKENDDKEILDQELLELQEKLIKQVENEYNAGYQHIRQERERKRDAIQKVLPLNIPEGQARVNLLWKNIKLENSLFLSDDLKVIFNSDDGVLGQEVMKNAQFVAQYDYKDLDLYEFDSQVVNQNALYGVAVSFIDGWDSDEKQPLPEVVDFLSVIPDPKNWEGSKMRYIGFERKVSEEYLKSGMFKNVELIEDGLSEDQRRNDRAFNNANNTTYSSNEEELYSVYDHLTVHEGMKCLTTWANNRTLLIRYLEIEPLTKAEQLKPHKVKFPVQIHRRSPVYGRFCGASIIDEIGNDQDIVTQLTNLQLIQARQAALGPDKLVDQNLGINYQELGNKLPGGRIIPVTTNGIPIGNSIFTDQTPNPSQFPTQMIQTIQGRSEESTGFSSATFGQSLPGSQTKAEFNSLMANSNQVLSSIASNYMRGYVKFWEDMYRSYALNMGKGDKKLVSSYQNGKSLSKELKKEDFIKDGKVQVYIESASQESVRNEKAFAKLNAIAGFYLPNMKPGYAMNQFLRELGKRLNIADFDPKEYIQTSVDEEKAIANLELLNNDIEISAPEAGEDFKTYIDIYKQALDTPAKRKALQQYEEAFIMTGGEQQAPQGQTDGQAGAMAQNTVNSQLSQQNAVPSTAQVAM